MQRRQKKIIGGMRIDPFYLRWNNAKAVTRYDAPQEVVNLEGLSGRVAIDFGSGTGRNRPLFKNYEHVVAFDLPRSSAACEEVYSLIATNWGDLRGNTKVDLIFACLVFQHMSGHNLDIVLSDMRNMTKDLIVVTRDYMDDGGGQVEDYVLKHFDLVPGSKRMIEGEEVHFEARYTPKKESVLPAATPVPVVKATASAYQAMADEISDQILDWPVETKFPEIQ